MQNNSPKTLKRAQKATILHTLIESRHRSYMEPTKVMVLVVEVMLQPEGTRCPTSVLRRSADLRAVQATVATGVVVKIMVPSWVP